MRLKVIMLSIVYFSSVAVGQKKELSLSILNCKSTSTTINVYLSVKNISEHEITTYIPKNDDICYGLIRYCIVDLKVNKTHEYRPCTFVASADNIILQDNNSVYLKSGETFYTSIQLYKKKIYPHLQKKGSYHIQVKWYFEGIEFKSKYKNLLRENIISNEFIFIN